MENKCAKCKYGKHLNSINSWYCDYLEMTGRIRPVKASECELYKDNPKDDKVVYKKKHIILG